jgi:glutathione S-transferase
MTTVVFVQRLWRAKRRRRSGVFWAITRLEVPFLVVSVGNMNPAAASELGKYFLKHVPMWTPEEVARSRAVLNGPFNVLNDKLSDSPYLLGSEFSVADLNVAMIMSRNFFAKVSLSGKPHLRDWLYRCWSRRACPRKDALLEALKGMQ